MVLAARHVIKERNLIETKRLITYTLENAVASSDTEKNALGQVLCIFDLSGVVPLLLPAFPKRMQ